MIQLLFFMALVSTIIPLRIEIKDKSPFFLLWLFNIIFVLLPLYVNNWGGLYSERTLIIALLYYLLANIIYTISLSLFRVFKKYRGYSIEIISFPLTSYKHTGSFVLFLILGIVLVFLSEGISFSRFYSSNLTDKRNLGGVQILLVLFLSCLAPFSIFYFLKKQKIKAFAIFFIFLVILLYFRSRSLLSLLFLPIAYYVFFWVKRGKGLLVFFGAFVYLISQVVKVIRYQGALSDGLSYKVIKEQLPVIIESNFKVGTGDLSIVEFYIRVIEDYYSAYWSGNWLFFKKFFNLFIPGTENIKTIEYELWDYYFSFGTNGSMHPTLYGYSYADGGIFGVLFFVFLAFSRVHINTLINNTKDVRILGIVMYFVLFASRGSLYNSFILLFSTLSLWYIASLLLLKNNLFKKDE